MELIELKPVFWWQNRCWNRKVVGYVAQAYYKGARVYARTDPEYEEYLFQKSIRDELPDVVPYPEDLPNTGMIFVYQAGSDRIYCDKEHGYLKTDIKRFENATVSDPQTMEYISLAKGKGRKHAAQYLQYGQRKHIFKQK